jgi:glucuronoarabinoxylan endo-1,4-beta-xylanase
MFRNAVSKALSGFVLVLAAAALPAGTVAVTTGTQYQVIQGFGASSYSESVSSAENTGLFTDQSNQALGTQNGNSIGLSILRLSIDEANSFAQQGNNAKNAVALNPNLQVFATSWSPPAADKLCNCVNGPGSGVAANTNTNFAPAAGATNVPSNLPAFATYQANFAKTLKSTYGVDLYAISPQNEPDWNTTYDSCLWTPQQFDTYIPLLSSALSAAGVGSVKIMMPESFADNLAGSNTTMADPAAAPLVSIVGMHLYGGGPTTVPASYSTVAGHAVQSWVTEISEYDAGQGYGKSGYTFANNAIHYAQQIHSSIVDHNFNAYCYWWIQNQGNNNDDEGLYDDSAAITPEWYLMGNWAKFIRPGYMRVSCTENPATSVQVSAYTGTATEGAATVNRVVIVAINGSGSPVSQAFNFTDQTVTQVYPWLSDNSDNLAPQAAVAVSGGQFTYTLPA